MSHLTESELFEIISDQLQEKKIGSFAEDVTIVVDVSKTRHASERQDRHGMKITDDEIIATAEEAADKIMRGILEDQIDPGDEILIRDNTYDLNVVCELENKRDNEFQLTVITVMRKKNFKPKSGTKVVDIY